MSQSVNVQVRPRLAVVLLSTLAVLSTGCALVGPNGPNGPSTPSRPEDRSCTTASVRSCALPYPSDEFTIADRATATGRRVVMPSDLVDPRLIDRLGPGARPADAFASADGFSSLTPVMFELDRSIVRTSVPSDGGDVVEVVDTATGESVPLRVEVPAEAARHGSIDTLVVAWPVTRYEFGHTYIARLGPGVRAVGGGAPSRAAGLDSTTPYTSALRAAVETHDLGPWDGVLSATLFTVRSEQNATAELDQMAAQVRSTDHPIRDLKVDLPLLVDHASAVVTGEVLISDFRDEHGVARAANGAVERWVPFTMVLPERAAGPDGAPVAIYGHGLLINKESMLVTAATNAAKGVATIGIDVPNHGARQYGGPDQGYLLELTSPRKFGRLASMPLQGIIDHVSLLTAVQQHLGDLELELAPLPGRDATPAPRLDTSRLLYQGTSMGGVLGAAFTALAPELDGAFLQVGGTGIADIIFHSLLWPLFMGVVPNGASAGDAYALMGSATMLLDHADNVNVLDRIRAQGTPVFLAYGVGDGVVPNFTSDRMIEALDLPLVGRQRTDIGVPFRSTGSEAVPADGWGAAQLAPNSPAELASFMAHLVFAETKSDRLLREWIDGRLVALGVPPQG